MADLTFNTASGQTIDRELLVAYLNTAGASATSPTWSPLGSRVTDSSEEIDWGKESSTDILGKTHTSMKSLLSHRALILATLTAQTVQ